MPKIADTLDCDVYVRMANKAYKYIIIYYTKRSVLCLKKKIYYLNGRNVMNMAHIRHQQDS